MNLLLALLAFAGLMAFLSTLLSVFIEGIHKALSLRRAGLEEMLRSLHAEVLARLEPQGESAAGPGVSTVGDAGEFARQMTANIAVGGRGRFSWIRRIPIISGLFQRRHEHLSTLQFVEQLARSKVGAAWRHLDPVALERALTVAAYQFERFGESQRAYFKARANVLSVVAALVFAFAVNVDALHIFNRLYRDVGLRDEVIKFINDVDSSNNAQGIQQAPIGDAGNSAQVQVGLLELSNRGVPIGYAAFPYCVGPASTLDERCVAAAARDEGVSASAIGYAPAASLDPVAAWRRLAGSERWFLWLVSVVTAGAFIGLGAPFWFQVFVRIARIVPLANPARAVLGSGAGPGNEPRPAGIKEVLRDPGAAQPSALTLAFRIAAGDLSGALSGGAGPARAPASSPGDGSAVSARTTESSARQLR